MKKDYKNSGVGKSCELKKVRLIEISLYIFQSNLNRLLFKLDISILFKIFSIFVQASKKSFLLKPNFSAITACVIVELFSTNSTTSFLCNLIFSIWRWFSWRFWFTRFKIIKNLINNFKFSAFIVYKTIVKITSQSCIKNLRVEIEK